MCPVPRLLTLLTHATPLTSLELEGCFDRAARASATAFFFSFSRFFAFFFFFLRSTCHQPYLGKRLFCVRIPSAKWIRFLLSWICMRRKAIVGVIIIIISLVIIVIVTANPSLDWTVGVGWEILPVSLTLVSFDCLFLPCQWTCRSRMTGRTRILEWPFWDIPVCFGRDRH